MKKLLWILVVLVLVVGAALYISYTQLGGIIEAAIEEYGADITATEVEVDAVDVDLPAGKAAINGFVIGTPAGFSADHTFRLDKIALALDTNNLSAEQVVINSLEINGPVIWYELGNGGSNIAALQNNVDRYLAESGIESPAEPDQADAATDGQAVKLVINDLYFRNASVNVSTTAVPGKKVSVTIPDLHLRDLGKSGDGVTGAELVDKILEALKPEIVKAASNIDPAELIGTLGDQAGEFASMLQKGVAADGGKLAEDLQKALEGKLPAEAGQIQEMLQNGSGDAEQTLEDATDGAKKSLDDIKGMFGK